MKLKSVHRLSVMFLLFLSSGIVVKASATDFTHSAGIINGTAPVIYNDKNEAGKVSFKRTNIVVDENDELDISDAVVMSWKVSDAEGDPEVTLPTVEWICTDKNNNKRVLARGVSQYAIEPEDKGCTLGVNITPTTTTGLPNKNETLSIEDISAYDTNDNIPTGPVNPHSLNMVGYVVAPSNANASYYAPASSTLHTAFPGAQIQLETDNVPDQLEWTTSNPSIATVSDSGVVTIKAKGGFRITARHNEARASITFSPQKFFIFSEHTKMNWYDAKAWCENQGYRMPSNDDLSIGTGKRAVPSDSLWQEWGSSLDDVTHAGVVLWSSDLMVAEEDAYAYMYTATGHISSNSAHVTEGVACILP